MIVTYPQLRRLLLTISDTTGVNLDDIQGPRRHGPKVKARRLYATEARKLGASMSDIACMLGRHRTTVRNLLA